MRRELDHTSPSGVEEKNKWRRTTASPVGLNNVNRILRFELLAAVPSGLWRRLVWWMCIDLSENTTSSIIRARLLTFLMPTSPGYTLRLKKAASFSYKMWHLYQATRRPITGCISLLTTCRNIWSYVDWATDSFCKSSSSLVCSPRPGFGRNQSPVRRPVWLWHSAF